MTINEENWSTHFYKTEQNRAFISFGGEPDQLGEVKLRYFVTLSNHDFEEVFQTNHESIEKALRTLNSKYGHWEIEAAQSKSDGGCGSCEAH